MNEIEIKIDFTKGTLATKGIALITGDYASTMLKFTFDREDGTKIFEMKNPSDEVVYVGEIINGEVLLTSKVDVTTIHNNKTYTKYTKNDAIYWYQPTDNKLFTDEWVEVSTFNLEEYTKVQVNASLFNESGKYIFEVSLYKDDTKLTSTKGILPVKQEQVIVGDEIVEAYIPIFDQLIQEINEKITEANNLDLDVTDTSGVVEATLTKKDGTTKTVEIIDRNDYYDKDEVDAIQTTIEAEIPTKVSELDNDLNFIDNTVDDLTNYTKTSDLGAVALSNDYDDLTDKPNLSIYSLITETGNKIDLEINSSTYVLTAKMYDKNNNLLSTSTGIDLPLETMVVGARYDDTTKSIILTLKNGQEVSFSVADLVSGLQTEITSDNMLSSDLVDDTGHTHKFVSSSDITNWNNKIDSSALTDYVKNTDYASENNAGVIIANSAYGANMYQGKITCADYTYAQYGNKVNSCFISKGTLENVIAGKELTNKTYVDSANEEQDTQIEELKQENELLLDQIPKGTATGQDITLNDSSNLPIKSIEISGNTEQDSTTGKNLFNKYGSLNEGGGRPNTISLNSQEQLVSTANYSEWRGRGPQINNLTANTNYTISGVLISATGTANNQAVIQILTTTNSIISTLSISKTETKPYQFSHTFNTGENTSILISISGNDDDVTIRPTTTFDNIQIEKNSTATSYEPYTGGNPAPYPDFPMEVKVVKGDNKIKVEGKNLNDGINDYFYITSTGTSYKYSSSDNGICIKVNGGNYTISTTATQTRYRVACSNELPSNESKECYNGVSKDETSNTITIDTTGYKYLLVNATNINIIQIEKGSSATTYEPYNGIDYPLNLGVKNLFNGTSYSSCNTGQGYVNKMNGQATIISSDSNNLTFKNDYTYGGIESNYISVKANKTYTISLSSTNLCDRFFITQYDSSKNRISTLNNPGSFTFPLTFTTTNDGYVTLAFTNTTLMSNNCILNNIQLEEGTTAHSYSPYGQEPIEMCNINNYKDVFVKPSGNNLVDSVETHHGINGSTGAITTENAYLGFEDYVSCEPNTTYTISFQHDVSSATLYVGYKTQNGTYIERVSLGTARTFTTPSNAYYMFVYVYYASGFSTIGGYVMLNEGSTALPYEPYNNNKWYKKGNIGKVVLDGSDTGIQSISSYDQVLSYTGEGTSFQASFSNLLTAKSSTEYLVISNYFNKAILNDRITKTNIIYSYVDGVLRIANTITNKPDFKTWLSTHNTIVYYVLDTPQYTLCTDTLQTQLDNIWNMKTNKNVTNISITSDDLKPYLDIVYRKDLETLLGG